MDESDEQPRGELTVRIPAMPADANANGDIFGGWVMSQMDLAAGIRASERARGRVATVAVNALTFKRPVKIGDTLCVYSTIEKVGRTSITLAIEAWSKGRAKHDRTKVTEATFVMVAIDDDGRPAAVPPETIEG
ncbi:acyl-CoA thioesterase [Aurantimonas sp. VKM B-3413]|uniref:acyl-CoA thioesterase n=1 Tax=Aurantimonas sp. VKM B-3413 TaxID=2779401 RepID=UPI001E51B4D6|nr:acyl-CoA thioesterase [Aurantimonas sp. VKM B-3413]MCB8836511.1 acyl-CoA thioesterase [Aurantimonas sp. VKM B-3413]